MAREILFKAKRIDNGEWVEGSIITRRDTKRVFMVDIENITALRSVTTNYCDRYDWRSVEVQADTICQYTGLTDKNGNKIWENDVVKKGFYTNYEWFANSEEYIGKVEYEDCAWNIIYNKNGDKYVCPICMAIEYGDAEYFEVIGNIFDNPELLGGGRE